MKSKTLRSTTSKRALPTKISVNFLADQTGLDRRTVRKRLADAGLFPPEDHPQAEVLAAVKPADGVRATGNYKEKEQFERWRKLRIKNDRDERKLVPIDDVIRSLAEFASAIEPWMEQKFVNEWPSAVAGMDVPQARLYGRRTTDEWRKQVRTLMGKWTI